MGKTIVLGDTHGRTLWKAIYEKEKPERLIFIGDYFDSFNIPSVNQQDNFLDIIEFKKSGACEVILLIGNHDYHYYPEIGDQSVSGYQMGASVAIEYLIDQNREHLQMIYQMDNILFTHAGVSEVFLNDTLGVGWKVEEIYELITDLWKYKPFAFSFNGFERTGDNMCQTPIWIRPRSLMKASQRLKKSIIQVVGHTGVNQIDIEGKATGGRYYFIDTLGHTGEYLIINDGKFTCDTINEK